MKVTCILLLLVRLSCHRNDYTLSAQNANNEAKNPDQISLIGVCLNDVEPCVVGVTAVVGGLLRSIELET
jgi:hypothetical protein